MKLKIESTETGEVFNARLESSIDKLKNQVSLVTRIPIQDQILLIGPPYKILDTQYGPNLNVEDKRIFVFNRRILSSDNQEVQRVKLLPFEVSKPLNEFNQLPSSLSHTVSPSAQYLLEFEKYFQEQLMRGQCYESFIVEVYKSCRESVFRHQIQLDGVDAAINNLKDTYQAIKKPFDTLEKRLLNQQARHHTLLSEFDGNLERLRAVSLHASLISAIEKQKAEVGLTGSTLDGNTALVEVPITTLYDCIPVERERLYHQQSMESFQKVDEQLQRVRSNYEAVSSGVSVLSIPSVNFEHLNHLLEQLSGEVDTVTAMVAEMKKNYQFVYDTITSATAVGSTFSDVGSVASAGAASQNSSGDVVGMEPTPMPAPAAVHNMTTSTLTSALQAAPNAATLDLETLVSDMARRKFNQERQQYFVILDQKTAIVKGIKQEVEDSQNQLVGDIYAVMRAIAQLQTDIQYRLKKDVDWMKKMTNGSNEYFKHLEHLSSLPLAYDHLLHEIVRRKAYNGVFDGEVGKAFEKISQLRTDEIREREIFMTTYGLCLPPIFFKIIPTLKDKPPYFQPNITDEQWLPDVHYEDLDRQTFLGLMHEMSSPSRDGRANLVYSEQQQLQHLSRVHQTAVSSSSAMPQPLNFSDAASHEGFVATQSQIDELLAGGAHYRSNANSVLMVGRDDLAPSTLTIQSTGEFPSATTRDRAFSTAGGTAGVGGATGVSGSVILQAQNRDEGIEELQTRYDRQVYENAKLLRMVDDMRKQLAAANAHIEKQQQLRGRTRTQSDAVDPPQTPPIESVMTAAPTAVDPVGRDTAAGAGGGNTAAPVTNDSTPVESAAVSTLLPTPPLAQSSGALDELLDSFIESFRFIQDTLLDESTIRYQIQFLESHGYITDLPEAVKDLKLLKGSIPLKRSKESASSSEPGSEELGSLITSVFTLISKMRQCLSHSLRNPVITFMEFQVGDIALFMPLHTDNRKVWIAFNSNSPYHFLADTSVDIFLERSREKENRKFILGRIVFIDTYTTSAEYAPYPIPVGTQFHVCHCEPLKGRALRNAPFSTTTTATATSAAAPSWAAVVGHAAGNANAGESSSSSSSSTAAAAGAMDGPFSAPR